MSAYDLEKLAKKYKSHISREKSLIKISSDFLNGMVSKIDSFCQDAIKIGLKNVQSCKNINDDNNIIEKSFTLNDCRLLLVLSKQAWPIELRDNNLCSKIYIFPFSEIYDDVEPYIEISIQEVNINSSYRFDAVILSTSSNNRKINGGTKVDSESGRSIAEQIIAHFYYDLYTTWADNITLRSIRNKKDPLRKIGFNQSVING